jgi:hypothetical protein
MKIHLLCDSVFDKTLLQLQALKYASLFVTNDEIKAKKNILSSGDGVGAGFAKFKSSQDYDENLCSSITSLNGDGVGCGDYYYADQGRGDGYTERFSWSVFNITGGFIYGNSCGSGSGDSSKFT